MNQFTTRSLDAPLFWGIHSCGRGSETGACLQAVTERDRTVTSRTCPKRLSTPLARSPARSRKYSKVVVARTMWRTSRPRIC